MNHYRVSDDENGHLWVIRARSAFEALRKARTTIWRDTYRSAPTPPAALVVHLTAHRCDPAGEVREGAYFATLRLLLGTEVKLSGRHNHACAQRGRSHA